MMVSFFSIASIVLAFTCSALSVFLCFAGKAKLHRIWALFNGIVALWGAGAFWASQCKTISAALSAWRFAHVGVIFIAVFFFHTILVFCESEKKYKPWLLAAYIQGFFFLVLNFFDLFIKDVGLIQNKIYYPQHPTLFYSLFFGIWVILVLAGLCMLFFYYRKATPYKRVQILYFFTGMLIGFSGGITNFFPMFGLQIYPYGNITIPLYSLIVTYAIFRYHLTDVRVVISSVGIFLGVYSVFLGIPFIIGSYTHSWQLTGVSMLILATAGPLSVRYLQKKAADKILVQQRRYQKLLADAGRGMAEQTDINKLAKSIVYIVKAAVKLQYAAIFLRDDKNKAYTLRFVRNSGAVHNHATLEDENVLTELIKVKKRSFIAEELPPGQREYMKIRLDTDFAMIVPAFYGERMLGFLVLGEKRDGSHFSPDDVRVFDALAYQAALAVNNCILVEKTQNAMTRVFATAQLASLGSMAAGLSHQIKNRLNHFSVAAGEMGFELNDLFAVMKNYLAKNDSFLQNLTANNLMVEPVKKLLEDREIFQQKTTAAQDYLDKITKSFINNVFRTNDVIQSLNEYAQKGDKSIKPSDFSLKEIIRVFTKLLKIKHKIEELPLEIKLDGSDTIYGNPFWIQESLYNLIDNSIEACHEYRAKIAEPAKLSYRPQVTLYYEDKPFSYYFKVSDNGVGIAEEFRPSIFAPWQTTKSSFKKDAGGLGVFVIYMVITQNHHGRMWFESEYMTGKGSSFFIEVPKKGRELP